MEYEICNLVDCFELTCESDMTYYLPNEPFLKYHQYCNLGTLIFSSTTSNGESFVFHHSEMMYHIPTPYGNEISCGCIVHGNSKPFILLNRKVAKMLIVIDHHHSN